MIDSILQFIGEHNIIFCGTANVSILYFNFVEFLKTKKFIYLRYVFVNFLNFMIFMAIFNNK